MKEYRRTDGFSLVELLAVIMVISILVAMAVPLYVSTSRTSMARVCRSNLTGIVKVLAVVILRLADMPPPGAGSSLPPQLVGFPEGFTEMPACPIDGAAYEYFLQDDGSAVVRCRQRTAHAADTGLDVGVWSVTITKPHQSQ
jgi:prepilin-type N-terminal cleavage/methylation domain-containing protein